MTTRIQYARWCQNSLVNYNGGNMHQERQLLYRKISFLIGTKAGLQEIKLYTYSVKTIKYFLRILLHVNLDFWYYS